MAVAKEESQLLVVTKKQIMELLKQFSNVSKEMRVVASRRLLYLNRSIEEIKKQYDMENPDRDLEVDDDNDNFLLQSKFMRPSSQMRSGEITLQKIRINKKLKDKKTVALDVLKMLNEFDEMDKDRSSPL